MIELINFLLAKPGYLKKSSDIINKRLSAKYSDKQIVSAKINVKQRLLNNYNPEEHRLSPIEEIEKSTIKIKPTQQFKRLFFDIETSYNIVSTWRVGFKINIGPENIIKERAIICICWKWQGEDKVYSLQWNKGDDRQMLEKFVKVMNQADEVVGQNSHRFDIKWLRTRCIYHGVPMMPKYQSLDTLKLAKSGFLFNSNKLDYIGKFLGVGRKRETGGFKLWQDIVIDNCSKSMQQMIDYCKQDVVLLEKVYDKLNPYTEAKTHYGVVTGGSKCSCSNCGSQNLMKHGSKVSAVGTKKQVFKCKNCYKFTTIALTTLNTYNKHNINKL